MQIVPQTMPMSAFNKTPKLVVEAVQSGPILVMNRSDTVGMLVDTEQWNRTARRLAELEGFFQAIEISNRMDREGDDGIDHHEIWEQLSTAKSQ